MTDLNLTSLIAQIGISGIFLWIAWQLYKDNKETVKTKDEELKQLNQKVLDAFNAHTEASTKLKESLEDNNTLTQKMFEVIISKNGNKP